MDQAEEVDIKPSTIMFAHGEMFDGSVESDASNNRGQIAEYRHLSPSVESYDDNDVRRRQQLDFEERQLALEERRLALEERRFEVEREERLRRLEIEIKEREARIKLQEQQQEIVRLLLSQYRTN